MRENLVPGNPGRTRTAYQAEAAAWSRMLLDQSTRRREDRTIPESTDDWFGVVATATCHTPGCAARGRRETRRFLQNANGLQGVCFACGRPTRITALFDGETAEVELPNAAAPPAPPAPDGVEHTDPDDHLGVLGGR